MPSPAGQGWSGGCVCRCGQRRGTAPTEERQEREQRCGGRRGAQRQLPEKNPKSSCCSVAARLWSPTKSAQRPRKPSASEREFCEAGGCRGVLVLLLVPLFSHTFQQDGGAVGHHDAYLEHRYRWCVPADVSERMRDGTAAFGPGKRALRVVGDKPLNWLLPHTCDVIQQVERPACALPSVMSCRTAALPETPLHAALSARS